MVLSEIAKPYYLPSEIASIIQDCGYRAEMKKLDSGRTVIRSAAGGFAFSIYCYGTKENKDHVTTVQFSSSFSQKVTTEQVNKWNQKKRFIKAYADSDGELVLEWDIVVTFISLAAIKECLEWWEAVISMVGEI